VSNWHKTRVRAAVASLLALTLAACTVGAPKQSASWSSATGAEQFERLLWQEVKAKNWTEVERRLAPTFVEATASGVRDRNQALERLKALQVADYSLGELAVRPNGGDMVVAYTITLRAASGGETTLRMMTVWQQVKGGWIAIAHSETGVSSP
jgi:hypothetical protein